MSIVRREMSASSVKEIIVYYQWVTIYCVCCVRLMGVRCVQGQTNVRVVLITRWSCHGMLSNVWSVRCKIVIVVLGIMCAGYVSRAMFPVMMVWPV